MQLDGNAVLQRSLARAAKLEERIRTNAFLPVQQSINGVLVDQFRLNHLTLLRYVDSPFMIGGNVTDEDVVRFMWIVGGSYNPEGKGRQEYIAALLKTNPIDRRFARAVDRYVDRALMDMPGGSDRGKAIAASFTASVIHRIAMAYGWDDEDILQKPVARLFQYMNWIAVTENPKIPQFNRLQDLVKKRLLREEK